MSRKRNAKRAARAAYNHATPTSDNWRQFAQSYPQTSLNVLPRWTRESLQRQARTEYEDNQHAGGIARLFSTYVVGTGPRLKFKGFPRYMGERVDKRLAAYVNYRWERFSDAIQLTTTLQQAMVGLVVDGEAFLTLAPNPRVDEGFTVRNIDAARVGNPSNQLSTKNMRDGVFFDEWGNPDAYCVYKIPETAASYYMPSAYDIIDASQIFHLFRLDYAGQSRGVSWFEAALPLLQQLREYTAAVIETAKRGAKLVNTFESQSGISLDEFQENFDVISGDPSTSADAATWPAWGRFQTGNGEALILPPGATSKTFSPSQPTAEASAFTSSILGQIGYSLGLPRNKATGSSHEYNFASGRLDNQPFEMLISSIRLDLFERRALDKLLKTFYACILNELLERFDQVPEPQEIEWEWIWPTPPLIDPESAARTNAIRLKSAQATLSEVWNKEHPFSDFDEMRGEIMRDERDFPQVFDLPIVAESFGVEGNTTIQEPAAPGVPNETI